MESYNLSDREKAILRNVIHQFILTASPVGSRNIAKKYDLGLSPATIRNIMADLEETGFLGHPHTSAGRIPTDKGYRLYVDSLMELSELEDKQKQIISSSFENAVTETEELLKLTSFLLSDITNQLACVTFPRFSSAILEKLQLVKLSATRILVVLSIRSGLVKTITMELDNEMAQDHIEAIQQLLNERLTNLSFSEIKNTFQERIKDVTLDKYKPIIRFFIDSANKIFSDVSYSDKAFITGAKNILKQPGFDDLSNFQSIIELIENKDVIIHIMDSKRQESGSFSVSIGSENQIELFSNYSFIVKDYRIGDNAGILGVIGPKRMEYSKSIAAIIYIAELLSIELKRI